MSSDKASERALQASIAKAAADDKGWGYHAPKGYELKERAAGLVALITGGGKGVGAGVARVFCAHGIRCCMGYNTSAALAEHTLAGIRETGGDAFLYQADVTVPEQLQGMIDATIARYGRLDVLVNNAAMQPNRFIGEYTAEEFSRLWDINIGGYWRAARGCLPWLRKSPNAHIINVSSVHGKRPTCFDAGYAMTKGAIRMFTRELALELLRDGITVNAVDLGGCAIEGKTGGATFRGHMPVESGFGCGDNGVNTLCVPEDVGRLAYFLVSGEGDALTGDGIRVDRGLLLL